MSEPTIPTCDGCGRQDSDFRSSVGWIRISGVKETPAVHFTLVTENGVGGSGAYALPLDFCNLECLSKWITRAGA
jgi:hypothetical protein